MLEGDGDDGEEDGVVGGVGELGGGLERFD